MTSSPDNPADRIVVQDPIAIDGEPESSGRGLWPWLGVGLVVALIAALGAGPEPTSVVEPIVLGDAVPPPSLAADPLLAVRGPALGEETGVIVVFDDGLDGLLFVDPDRRIATRRTPGLLRQSRRAQLDQIGDSVVVGGVVTEVVSLTTRQTSVLPDVSYHLVAPDGTLWLIDLRADAEVIPIPVVTRIDLDGAVLVPATDTAVRGVPSAAVGDDVVLDTPDGLFRWNPVSGDVEQITADGGALVLGASGQRLAWCRHECTSIIVADFATDTSVEIPIPDGLGAVDHTTTAWAPSGEELVVVTTEAVVRVTGIATTPEVIVLVEYAIGAGAPRFVAWDPSGDHVFFATDSPRGRLTGVWRSDGTRLGTATTTLPFSGAGGPMLVLDATLAGWLVGERLGPYEDCPAPATVQLPEPNVCSFRF